MCANTSKERLRDELICTIDWLMLFNNPAKDSDEFFKAAAISLLNNFSSLASPINRSSRCYVDNFLCRCLRLSSINWEQLNH